jgi:hypothetical protein
MKTVGVFITNFLLMIIITIYAYDTLAHRVKTSKGLYHKYALLERDNTETILNIRSPIMYKSKVKALNSNEIYEFLHLEGRVLIKNRIIKIDLIDIDDFFEERASDDFP